MSGEKNTGLKPNFVLVEEQKESDDAGKRLYNDDPEERLYYKTYDQPSKPKPKRKSSKNKVFSILLIVLLSAGAGFGGGAAAVHYMNLDNGSSSTQAHKGITINTEGHVNTAEAVAAKVIPSVVGISTTMEVVRQNIFGMVSDGIAEGVGTGIIVNEDGFILTNSHVVSDGQAKTITVQLTDGRELQGTVLWNDVILDLAVVKIDEKNLTAAELGNSDKVNIGAYAVAIGNPLGLAFDRSVTQGVISGLNRTITVSDQNGSTTMEGLMQTDASINSGNSGGPLLNSEGQVIGINSAKAASGEGLGFAIPINTVKPIIDEVMKTGTFSKAFIGIEGADAELYLQYYPNDNLGTDNGVYVSRIYSGSPAYLAGLKEKDVIVELEDKKIETMEQLTRDLFAYKPGEKVEFTIYRNAKKMKLEVTLGTAKRQE